MRLSGWSINEIVMMQLCGTMFEHDPSQPVRLVTEAPSRRSPAIRSICARFFFKTAWGGLRSQETAPVVSALHLGQSCTAARPPFAAKKLRSPWELQRALTRHRRGSSYRSRGGHRHDSAMIPLRKFFCSEPGSPARRCRRITSQAELSSWPPRTPLGRVCRNEGRHLSHS